jgi:capsular exopolysaccharide synthesis family protein
MTPPTDSNGHGAIDVRLVSLVKRRSFEADQFRRLRYRIEDQGASHGRRVVAITSAGSRDGKTLTAINLAAALAEGRGARILLIDADLRQPSVGSRLGISAGRGGLYHAVGSGRDLTSDDLYRVEGSTLDVLPCERSGSETYELLTSRPFASLLESARRSYDYVVVDTPPVVPVPDGALLRPLIDGYLVVVAANQTPRKLVAETLDLLEPTSVMGIVFNRDARPLFGYYRSYYKRYFQAYEHAPDGA